MDAVRRNKHMFGNKIDDIQLSSLSSSSSSTPNNSGPVPDSANSDAMKSSLLVDTSNASSVPYDMSLIDLDLTSYPAKVPSANGGGTRWQEQTVVGSYEECSYQERSIKRVMGFRWSFICLIVWWYWCWYTPSTSLQFDALSSQTSGFPLKLFSMAC